MPTSPEGIEAERDARLERETREAVESGHAEWEVRIELPDHEATARAAERLEAEGIHRRPPIAVPADRGRERGGGGPPRPTASDEELPGATVHVQPGGEMVWEVTPSNPFAILGGLGG